jgi:hypothetical protein
MVGQGSFVGRQSPTGVPDDGLYNGRQFVDPRSEEFKSQRPFNTSFGLRQRPHFEIIGWKTPNDGSGNAVEAKPETPTLSGPANAAPAEKAGSAG